MTASTENRPQPVDEPESRPGLFGLSLPQVLAGAAAAVTSALIAGRIGVAGTLIGAALGSMVSTVAAAAYSHSLTTASSRLKQVRTTVVPVQSSPAEQGPSAVPATTPELRPERRRRSLTLRTGLVLGLATFVVAVAAVTVLEVGLGRPVSADDGSGSRTSVGEIFGGTSSTPSTPEPVTPTPATDPSPTDSPTTEPTDGVSPAPTDPAVPEPSTEPTDSSSPSTSPSSSPSEQSVPAPSPDPTQPPAAAPAPVTTP